MHVHFVWGQKLVRRVIGDLSNLPSNLRRLLGISTKNPLSRSIAKYLSGIKHSEGFFLLILSVSNIFVLFSSLLRTCGYQLFPVHKVSAALKYLWFPGVSLPLATIGIVICVVWSNLFFGGVFCNPDCDKWSSPRSALYPQNG